MPTQYEWNADIQYEFVKDWVFQLGYVGSRGIHEPYTSNFQSVDLYNAAQIASVANPIHCGYDGNPADCITTNTTRQRAQRACRTSALRPEPIYRAPSGTTNSTASRRACARRSRMDCNLQASYSYSRSFNSYCCGVPSLSTVGTPCCLLNPKGIYGINPDLSPEPFDHELPL